MHGQYLMNKEISVQYAYKKDGKGERHGDEAERMLASQARKHNVQPQTQPLPPHLMGSQGPMGPGAPMMAGGMPNGDAARPMPPSGPPDYSAGRGAMPLQVPQQPRPGPPAQPMAAPLAAPPPGLPARPPPSQAGYGGPPQGFAPPGFNNAAQATNYPPAPAPPGFAPPPGFGGTQGAPPPLPPGFQPPGYGRGR